MHRRRPNACSIHRLVWAPLLAFDLNCILNVLVVLVRLDMTGGIPLFRVRRNSVVRNPLSSLEYCSNYRNTGLYIRTFHCRRNAFFLLNDFQNRRENKTKHLANIHIKIEKKTLQNSNDFNMYLFLQQFNWIVFTWTTFWDNGTKRGWLGRPFQALWIQNIQTECWRTFNFFTVNTIFGTNTKWLASLRKLHA